MGVEWRVLAPKDTLYRCAIVCVFVCACLFWHLGNNDDTSPEETTTPGDKSAALRGRKNPQTSKKKAKKKEAK